LCLVMGDSFDPSGVSIWVIVGSGGLGYRSVTYDGCIVCCLLYVMWLIVMCFVGLFVFCHSSETKTVGTLGRKCAFSVIFILIFPSSRLQNVIQRHLGLLTVFLCSIIILYPLPTPL